MVKPLSIGISIQMPQPNPPEFATRQERFESSGAPPTALTKSRESPWRSRDSNRRKSKCVCQGAADLLPLSRDDAVSIQHRY